MLFFQLIPKFYFLNKGYSNRILIYTIYKPYSGHFCLFQCTLLFKEQREIILFINIKLKQEQGCYFMKTPQDYLFHLFCLKRSLFQEGKGKKESGCTSIMVHRIRNLGSILSFVNNVTESSQ